jgi:hypothetical protein
VSCNIFFSSELFYAEYKMLQYDILYSKKNMNRLLPIDLYAAPCNVSRSIEHCRCLYQNYFFLSNCLYSMFYINLYRAKYDQKHWR